MSLLKPKLGEVLDRLTIVAMKRLRDKGQGLEGEWQELQRFLRDELSNESAAPVIAVAELAAINAALWSLVEALSPEDPRQQLNLQRAEAVRKLGGDDVKV